ncbi:MAG: hypothetical protein ACETWM_19420 [Candidatus Lokiarchaeia archaeon]
MEEGRELLSWIIVIAIPSLIAIGMFLFIFLVFYGHLQKYTWENLFVFGVLYSGITNGFDLELVLEVFLPRFSEMASDVAFLNPWNLVTWATIITGLTFFVYFFCTPTPWMIRKRLEKKPPSPPD